MRRVIVALVSLVLLGLVGPAHADASQSTIFFDDFVSSQLSPSWTVNPGVNLVNVTQAQGYLTMTANRFANPSSSVQIAGAVISNGTGTIIDSTTNGTFFQMVVKEQPFNLTGIPLSGVNRFAETDIALLSTGGGGFGIQMFEEDQIAGGFGWAGMRTSIGLDFSKPPSGGGGTIHCFGTQGKSVFGGCSPQGPTIAYSPNTVSNPIDLNAQHIFTLRMRLWQGTDVQNGQKSWVAMEVDNLGWINESQTACLCISPPATSFANLYPVLGTSLCVTSGAGLCNKNPQSSQSVGTNVDYVLITNYVPATLPAGQLLFSNVAPPPSIPNPYNAFGPSDSLVAFMIFEANSFAPGNIYAGGMLFLALIVGTLGLTFGALVWRFKFGLGSMGFMWTLGSLGICFFFFYCQIVPLWLPVIQTVLTAGIVFGIIKTSSYGDGGGVVPD